MKFFAFAVLIGACVIAAALVYRSAWEFQPAAQGATPYVWRLNHLTGEIDLCTASAATVGAEVSVRCIKAQ